MCGSALPSLAGGGGANRRGSRSPGQRKIPQPSLAEHVLRDRTTALRTLPFRRALIMYFIALASDYDGTLAEDGRVAATTLEALVLLKQSARQLILATG